MKRAREKLKEAKIEADKCKCTEIEKQKVIYLGERLKDKEEIIKSKNEYIEFNRNQLERTEEELSGLKVISQNFNDLKVKDQKLIDENEFLKVLVKDLKEYKFVSEKEKLGRKLSRLKISEGSEEKIEELNSAY